MTHANETPAPRTWTLVDPCTMESTVSFTVLDDGRVEVADQYHPDVPADVSVCGVEEARNIYRAAVKTGCVPA